MKRLLTWLLLLCAVPAWGAGFGGVRPVIGLNYQRVEGGLMAYLPFNDAETNFAELNQTQTNATDKGPYHIPITNVGTPIAMANAYYCVFGNQSRAEFGLTNTTHAPVGGGFKPYGQNNFYVNLGAFPQLFDATNTTISVSIWGWTAYPNSWDSDMLIGTDSTAIGCYLNVGNNKTKNNVIEFLVGNGSTYQGISCTNLSTVITNATWYHIVCSLNLADTNQSAIYVDGVRQTNIFKIGNGTLAVIPKLTNKLYLGLDGNEYGSGGGWAGNLDEARFYNRVLGEAEAQQLYGWKY